MERPSHLISTLSLQSGARRFGGISLAVLAQSFFVAVLIGGVVDRVQMNTPPPLQVDEVKPVEPKTPPPPIKVERAVMPTIIEPQFVITQEPSGTPITIVPPRAETPPVVVAPRQTPPVAMVADRAAAAIAEPHTSPPYPTLARRLGAQGKVMLRLTVLPDGAVGKAEVVTSSGRQGLDQAAPQWITGHWTYKPAIRDGAPATAQVLAAVQFNLADAQ
jgi:protein TonB